MQPWPLRKVRENLRRIVYARRLGETLNQPKKTLSRHRNAKETYRSAETNPLRIAYRTKPGMS